MSEEKIEDDPGGFPAEYIEKLGCCTYAMAREILECETVEEAGKISIAVAKFWARCHATY